MIEETIRRIESLNERTNAFRDRFDEEALASARRIDEQVAAGKDPGPLAGVPVGLKDNITTTEGTVTCGSRMLDGYRSPFDATVVTRLREAGAIPVGHTNCDEFAMGSSTETCFHGPVRNPWDPSRVPGGSSGGSAAAVSAGLVPLCLGSDTGGSIRQPAALCGCVGLKPSYGRVVGTAWSPSGRAWIRSDHSRARSRMRSSRWRSSQDMTLLIRPRSTDPSHPARPRATGFEGLRIGIPSQYRVPGANEPAVEERIERVIDLLGERGAEVVDIDLPLTEKGHLHLLRDRSPRRHRATSLVSTASATGIGPTGRRPPSTSCTASRAEGFGPEVQRRIMLGTYVLSSGYYDAYYNRALQARRLIKEEFDRAFESCDILLGPTTPTTAFSIG